MAEIGGARSSAPLGRAEVVLDFTRSELFDRTFNEGMALVEETAAYLDGEGRRDSKLLSRAAALSYAAESMKLTTRLMQIASWLLVQRAVRELLQNAFDAVREQIAHRLDDRRFSGTLGPKVQSPGDPTHVPAPSVTVGLLAGPGPDGRDIVTNDVC